MNKHNFPADIKKYSFQMKDFLGVDFTTHESEVNDKRSPDAINLISGLQGSVDKRFGTEIIKKFSGRIWSVHNIKTWVYGTTILPDGTKERFEVNATIVHEGTRLWAYNPHLNTWQRAVDMYLNPVDIQERPTNFIEWNNQSYFTLLHNNWVTDKNDLLVMSCTANTMTGNEGKLFFWLYVNDPVNYLIYIPRTSIARSPNGLTSTNYEPSNLIINARVNKFLSNASDTVFKLDYGTCYSFDGSGGFVMQMQADGKFSSALHDASGTAITATFTAGSNIVTFSGVPHATYKTGVDNIEIWFRTDKSTKKVTANINDYDSFSSFGLGGLNNFTFFCNNREIRFRHKEIWMEAKKDTEANDMIKFYLSSNNYSILGSNRKLGYSKVGEYLVLHGEREGLSPVAYLKRSYLDDNGELVFSNVPTTSQVGALSPNGFANLRDDPLWISEAGVSSVIIDNITNVQSIQDRGFYINQKLLQEPNLDNALAFVFDNKYFVCVNGNVYIADSRRKSMENKSYSESFQYEWYYWEGLDVQTHEVVDGELLFGTTDGRLMKYKNANSDYPYCDEVLATPTLWATATNYVKGNIVHDGASNYYVCLANHLSTYNPLAVGKYWNKIIVYDTYNTWTVGTYYYVGAIVTKNGIFYECIQNHQGHESNNPKDGAGAYLFWVISNKSAFQIPVIAYWTTPIINMGDTTMRKTLKNLWIRLGKYAHMRVKVYYSTKGVESEKLDKYDGLFDFSDLDFNQLTFSTDTDPSVMVTNRQERKFMSIQFKVESRDVNPFSLLELVGKYTFNNQYKG